MITPRLYNVAGPDCPKCGCNGARLTQAEQRGTFLAATFHCDNCRHEFQFTGRGEKRRPQCSGCGSLNTIARSTPGRKQYRLCRECGERFSDVI